MVYEVIKNKIDDSNIAEKHFGIPIYKKDYPSCYQYNVLVMLAKRLIREEEESANRLHLNKRLAKKVFSFEK